MSGNTTEFEQVSLKVQAAEKMVGSATLNMDQEMLEHANTTVQEAREQLEKVKEFATDLDTSFLSQQEALLQQIEHQLHAAEE